MIFQIDYRQQVIKDLIAKEREFVAELEALKELQGIAIKIWSKRIDKIDHSHKCRLFNHRHF